VKFHPLDMSDDDSINDLLMVIDNIIQYGEDEDVKEPKEYENDNDN
jgi:GPN-loop GTPase